MNLWWNWKSTIAFINIETADNNFSHLFFYWVILNGRQLSISTNLPISWKSYDVTCMISFRRGIANNGLDSLIILRQNSFSIFYSRSFLSFIKRSNYLLILLFFILYIFSPIILIYYSKATNLYSSYVLMYFNMFLDNNILLSISCFNGFLISEFNVWNYKNAIASFNTGLLLSLFVKTGII